MKKDPRVLRFAYQLEPMRGLNDEHGAQLAEIVVIVPGSEADAAIPFGAVAIRAVEAQARRAGQG